MGKKKPSFERCVAQYMEACDILRDALSMYADPSFYHAITIIGDRPTGGFDEDVSRVRGSDYERPMPGRLAREALRKADRHLINAALALPPQERGAGEP